MLDGINEMKEYTQTFSLQILSAPLFAYSPFKYDLRAHIYEE